MIVRSSAGRVRPSRCASRRTSKEISSSDEDDVPGVAAIGMETLDEQSQCRGLHTQHVDGHEYEIVVMGQRAIRETRNRMRGAW